SRPSAAAVAARSRLSAARSDASTLVGDTGDLPRAHLDAPAEVEHPLLPQGRVALAELGRPAEQLRHVSGGVRHAIERQNGPELTPDPHLHRLDAELGVARVPHAGWRSEERRVGKESGGGWW